MNDTRAPRRSMLPALVITLVVVATAGADIVTDWDGTACDIVVGARLTAPAQNRILAIVATAVYEATNAITRRDPASPLALAAAPGASVPAAIAAANRVTLTRLLPAQQEAVDDAYQAALAAIPDGVARTQGIAVGERSAEAVLTMRADDGSRAEEEYRPYTSPGVYVPTVIPAVPQWPRRMPWLMTDPAQFRPGPPPELSTAVWARDYQEIKAVGAKNSVSRTAEQTEIARFWEATVPHLYHGLVRAVADRPGRDTTQNARLLAAVTQASDDALIAVFDAKYHYAFWRPVTAIRNGDVDGNEATERDPSWTPFIDTPMHPEYPCAHCIVAATVMTVLQAEVGDGPMPTLSTASPTAGDAARSWTNADDVVREVANARVCDGVHFRNSTEVGTAMGRQIGALAVAIRLRPAPVDKPVASGGR